MARKKAPAKTAKPLPETETPKPTTKLADTNPQPMEVHHHPEVEKKGFKEYLLEGLMIFLAVFMGFIAENIREDYTEHQKAKAFATTLVADLKADTASLKSYKAYYEFAEANTDTLMKLLSTKDIKDIPTGKLYLFGLWGGAQHFFIPNDATFQQMKSTGALQFFEKAIARQASEYDQVCRMMQTFDQSDEAVYVEVRKLRSQIFEFNYNNTANTVWNEATRNFTYPTKKAGIAKIDSFINVKPPLLTYDKGTINQYVELVRSRYINRKVIIADTVLVHATRLLAGLQKEYDTE